MCIRDRSLHLTSKMCIPRGEKSNRPLSTSWGRPAYMLSKKVFEQNPIPVSYTHLTMIQRQRLTMEVA